MSKYITILVDLHDGPGVLLNHEIIDESTRYYITREVGGTIENCFAKRTHGTQRILRARLLNAMRHWERAGADAYQRRQ